MRGGDAHIRLKALEESGFVPESCPQNNGNRPLRTPRRLLQKCSNATGGSAAESDKQRPRRCCTVALTGRRCVNPDMMVLLKISLNSIVPCVSPKSRFVLAPKYLRFMSKRNSRQRCSSGTPCPCEPHCSCRLFKLLNVSHLIEKKLPSDRSAGDHFFCSQRNAQSIDSLGMHLEFSVSWQGTRVYSAGGHKQPRIAGRGQIARTCR